MIKKTHLFEKLLFSLFLFFLTSCVTDLTGISKDMVIKPTLVSPVGELTVSVNDLLNNLDIHTIITLNDTVNYSYLLNKNIITDTIHNVEFGQDLQNILDRVDTIDLKMEATNNFPLKFKLSLKFLDKDNNVIPSVINSNSYIANAAQLELSDTHLMGTVKSPTTSSFTIALSSLDKQNLANATSLVYMINISNQDLAIPVRITNDNNMKIKIGLYAKGNISLSQLNQ